MSAAAFMDRLRACKEGEALYSFILCARVNEDICLFQTASKRYILERSMDVLIHTEDSAGTKYFDLVCDSSPHDQEPIIFPDDPYELRPEDEARNRPFTVHIHPLNTVDMDNMSLGRRATMIRIGWLGVEENSPTIKGNQRHTTNYAVTLNTATHPPSLWLVYDYFSLNVDDDLDEHFQYNDLENIHNSVCYGSLPRKCTFVNTGDDELQYSEDQEDKHRKGFRLESDDTRSTDSNSSATGSTQQQLSHNYSDNTARLDSSYSTPHTKLAGYSYADKTDTHSEHGVRGLKALAFRLFSPLSNHGERQSTPTSDVVRKHREDLSQGTQHDSTDAESSPGGGQDAQQVLPEPQNIPNPDFLGIPEPFDLALLAPDVEEWKSGTGFEIDTVKKALRTHVHLGNSLRVKPSARNAVGGKRVYIRGQKLEYDEISDRREG